ncbi:MAG: FIST C-terminal domain-containing protein [Candidatus Melainabacteria bacterium]|nr:FIST C-terminal domain-containing protein [Candidatus Melainabacteria bacterium]
MKWASSLELTEDLSEEIPEEILAQLPDCGEDATLRSALRLCHSLAGTLSFKLGGNPDLLLLFVSPEYREKLEPIGRYLRERLSPASFIGCTGAGLIGGGVEAENQSAIALTGAILPGVEMRAFHIVSDAIPDLDDPPDSWEKLMQVQGQEEPVFILLGDPFSFKIEPFVQGLDYAFPRSVKLGGLASGGHKAGEIRMLAQDRVFRSGLVALTLKGNIQVDPVLVQGCRAFGKISRVTRCDRNLLYELDGKPAVSVLKEAVERLSEKDQKLVKDQLFIGVAMDEFKDQLKTGDFLVRSIIGIEPLSGALLVGEVLRPERTVQFHLRDAGSSEKDLNQLFSRYVEDKERNGEPRGALLFSCLGRGQGLYGKPNYDSDTLRSYLGEIPIGGFFCNGEIGTVGKSTYLHNYTSSFGIFREK